MTHGDKEKAKAAKSSKASVKKAGGHQTAKGGENGKGKAVSQAVQTSKGSKAGQAGAKGVKAGAKSEDSLKAGSEKAAAKSSGAQKSAGPDTKAKGSGGSSAKSSAGSVE